MNGKGKIPKNRFQAIAKKYPLYLAIAGVAVSFIFSLENYAFEKGMVNFNVMDTYIYAVEMSGKMIAYAFCASAFAAVFCEDLENKYLRYSIGRGNLKKICAFKSNRDLCILHNNNDFRNTFIYHVFTATASLDI